MTIDFQRKSIVYDLTKISLQRRAAHQAAVNIRLCEQLCRIGSIYGSAVLDTNRLRGSRIIYLCDAVTDCLANLLSLLRSSRLAGSDCPDGLVSDHHGGNLL